MKLRFKFVSAVLADIDGTIVSLEVGDAVEIKGVSRRKVSIIRKDGQRESLSAETCSKANESN